MLVPIDMRVPVNFAARMFMLVRVTVPTTVSMHMVVLMMLSFTLYFDFAVTAAAGYAHIYSSF
jgi:hypothetical protein